jgi:prepilin-type N-terminal cleavage/methylation domain-containing protein
MTEMKFSVAPITQRHSRENGFTLIEVITAVAILGILAAVAVASYSQYVARAHAAELETKFGVVRTQIAIPFQSGQSGPSCDQLAAAVNPAVLKSDYAAIDVAFEPITGGFTPVMRFCASAGASGARGVDVVRETHHLLSRVATIGKGAVIGESVASFSVGLADGVAVCKTATPAATNRMNCGTAANTASATTPPAAAATPAATAPSASPTGVATGAGVVPSPATVASNPVAPPPKLAPMAESVSTDFSQPPIVGAWMSQDPSVWGWSTDNPDGKVEYGKGAAYGDTSGGNIGVIELEGYAGHPSNLYRTINAQPGARYEFTFDLSGRVGVSADSAAVQIIWEGKVVDTLYPPANAFGFVRHSYNLVASGTASRIELKAVTQDGTGPVVDNLAMAFKGLGGTVRP